MSRTCVATVIYKQAIPFLRDLFDSLQNQTDDDFELLVINDNCDGNEIRGLESDFISCKLKLHLIDLQEKHLSVVETRIEMLRTARQLGFDLAILVDADDIMSDNRVEFVKQTYLLDKQAVFFYNNLVTEKGDLVFSKLPKSVESAMSIAQENFLGLTNTAIRLDKISDDFLDSLQEFKGNVFDWYLFTRILKDIGLGVLVEETSTIYRIYDGNMVGQVQDISKERQVKLTHYLALKKRYSEYRLLYDKLANIDITNIKHSTNYKGYWWSDIKLEDTYEI